MTRFDPAKIASEYGLSVDEVRNRWLTLRVAYWKSDFKRFAREAVRIRTKEGELQPLVLNNAQNILHEAGEKMLEEDRWIRIAGLKGRRQGYSTYTAARGFWRATLWDRQKIYILSHEMNSSNVLFDMVALMQEKHPFPSAVGADNAKELEFRQRGSSYTVATAGQKAGGRGGAISFLHGCLSPESYIIEPNGNARKMRAFKVGDLVRTHTGQVAPVSFISKLRKPALSVKVLGVNEPLVATPEHKVWTIWGMRELGSLSVGDYIGYPVAQLGNEKLAWRFRRDYPRARGGGSPAFGPATVEASYEFGRILGLYLAEGCIVKQVNKGHMSRVSFTIHEREVERTLAWLEPLKHLFRNPPCVLTRKNSKTVTVTVGSRSFAELMYEMCGEKDSKHLPDEWRLNRDFTHGLVVGYFAGDGGGEMSLKTRIVKAPSIRSTISFGMRDALASLGYGWAGISRREGAVRHGRDEKTQWTIKVTGAGSDILWREMGREPFARSRKVRAADMFVFEDHAWFPIVHMEEAGTIEVMDFEVNHPDHSYCTWQGAVSNSEAAWWTNAEDHFSASVQAVDEVRGVKGVLWTRPRNPLPFEAAAPAQIEGWLRAPSEVWLETTSAGPSGTFWARYMDAMKGIGRYRHVFVPWTVQAEYTEAGEFTPNSESEEEGELSELEYQELHRLSDGQMLWRRNKLHELGSHGKFRQEYPLDIIEAFSAADTDGVFIKPALILKARKRSLGTPDAPLLIGVDPAGAGGDRFAMAGRRGDKCLWVRHRNKLEHDEAVAWICKVIDEERPSKVIIDRGSMGGNIISSLRALGPQYADVIKGVDFGGKSNAKLAVPNRSGPWNRRAEIWGKLRDWLATGVIPDDDDLASDLSAPKIKYRANNDWLLESKTEMKARGIRSPDLGDSLALTFGTQEYFENWSKPDQTTGFATGHEPATIHIDQRKEDSFSSGGGSTYGWMG
jgi:hypothetical protein